MLTDNILLPGGTKQLEHLLEQTEINGTNALIIGPTCELVAARLINMFSCVHIVSDEYDSVLHYRMKLKADQKIKINLMDYAHTDFREEYFDLIFAQGSISIPERKNILKELKRIISTKGTACIGEIVSLKDKVPEFVKDIWERSNLEPIETNSIKNFYESKGFNVISERDLSDTLKEFYENAMREVVKASNQEKEQFKKYFSRIKHESNAYLRHGGNKYIGFKSLIMRKSN